MCEKRKRIFLCLIVFSLPALVWAWGLEGHRIVGQIAQAYLTPKAKAEIKKILGNESIAMSSNWADFIKSDTTYRYLNGWHYIEFGTDMNYNQMQWFLKQDTAADAYTRINYLVQQLKRKTLASEKKKLYLRLLIHIVGDVHQPLHVSLAGDAGGNDIKLSWFGQPSNLHRVWDEQLILEQQLSYTEYAAAINFTTESERKRWQKEAVSKWLFDSYEISKQLHTEIKEANPKLSFLYNFQHLQLLNDRLLKAGVHLAGLLNSIFI